MMTTTQQSKPTVEPILPETRSDLRRLITAGHTLEYARPAVEVIADLSKPLPWAFLSWLEKKDKKTGKYSYLPYLHWYDCNAILDYVAPGWSGSLIQLPQGSRYVLGYEITLITGNGPLSRSSTGDEVLDGINFGSSATNSESQAFRRACSRFGLGLYLYDPVIKRSLAEKYINMYNKPRMEQ